ncbi:MAG: MBL fold metallo-hydrolase [Acidobacteriota bacterium]
MLQRITDNIQMIFTEDGFTFSNCVLIGDDTRVILDTGAGKLLNEVRPESIDLVINTHHHFDHVRGNDQFVNAKILMHPYEREAMQYPEKITAISGWNEVMTDDLIDSSSQIGVKPEDVLKEWRVDGEVHDNQVIDCGKTKFVVLHTPGHSAGHCSFYFPEEEMLFIGDICLTKVGPWYGEAQAEIEDYISSIDRILELKPKSLLTGHVLKVLNDPERRLTEYRDRIFKREQRIFNHLKNTPSTIDQLAEQCLIYRMHPTTFVLFWEKYMLKKHLDRLSSQGLVAAGDNGLFEAV